MSSLEEQAERLPSEPGVYLFKSEQGTVLYVGKAQSLKSRVRQYVAGGDGRIRIGRQCRRCYGDLGASPQGGRSAASNRW